MSQISETELSAITGRVTTNTEPLQKLITSIVSEYCAELDDYMRQVDKMLVKSDTLPTGSLEKVLLDLNSMLYWAGNGLEKATIKESVAKMVREEQYSKEYNLAEGTMGDKKSYATLNSQKEELARLCYTNAVKLYQHKIDKATEMASSIKKILTHRISEMELTRVTV